MRRKRSAAALAGGLALSIAVVIPSSAHEDHRSCSFFGESTSANAQSPESPEPMGQLVRNVAPFDDEAAAAHAIACKDAP